MKLCAVAGVDVRILTRNEHCPPHVHADGPDLNARFRCSFWNNDVALIDITTKHGLRDARRIRTVREALAAPDMLLRARTMWWNSMRDLCLVHQCWDEAKCALADARGMGVHRIVGASFDQRRNCTTLQFIDDCLEIML